MINEQELKSNLERMANEWRESAEEKGYNVDLNDPSEANSKEEAYHVGRYDQVLSVMDELDIDSELLDNI